MQFISSRRVIAAAMLTFAACAGAAVTQQAQQAPISSNRPTQVIVYPFAVDPSEVTLNQSVVQRAYRAVSGNSDEKQRALADDLSQSVCLNVASDLASKGYSAVCQKRGVAPFGDNVMVVDGEFSNVSEGNRLRRTVIGFGAGASTLDTHVSAAQRIQGESRQLLDFTTHADSGKMPGALVAGAPGAAAGGAAAVASAGVNVAAGVGKGVRSTLSSLAKMTSDQIVDHLTQYFDQQGWTPDLGKPG